MNRKAQSMLDYVIVIAVVVVTLLLMGHFVRNALLGKYRDGADVFGQGQQYIPFGGTKETVN